LSPRRQRALWITAGVVTLAAAIGLVLYALSANIVFFYTPSQVVANEAPRQRTFRIGGLVEVGSVQRDGIDVQFRVTDGAQAMTVRYRGTLPDLFREGKGVVAQGSVDPQGRFAAHEVLAKHDENYMPPEAAEALKQAGHPIETPSLVQP
jgi:cytochrome c-type biogenesis protein CcmE